MTKKKESKPDKEKELDYPPKEDPTTPDQDQPWKAPPEGPTIPNQDQPWESPAPPEVTPSENSQEL